MIALAAHDLKHLYRFLRVWAPPPRLTAPLGLVRAGAYAYAYAYSGTDRRCYEQVAHRSAPWTERRIGASSAVYKPMVRWHDRGGCARLVEAARTKRAQPLRIDDCG